MLKKLFQDLIAIHNAENWLGMDGDSELSMFNKDGKKDLMLDGADDIVVAPPKSKLQYLAQPFSKESSHGNLQCDQIG